MIVVSCSGCGMALAATHRSEEEMLYQLYRTLQWMECELSCRATNLPQLFYEAAQHNAGQLRSVLESVAAQLDRRDTADAGNCIRKVITQFGGLPVSVSKILNMCGRSLGEFHLEGQLQELTAVRLECSRILEEHRLNRENRVRTVQVLGLCTGAALAILLY